MKKNMGKADRLIRVLLGVIILAAGWYYQSWWGAVGAILLLTAFMSWCPIYVPLKISTLKTEDN